LTATNPLEETILDENIDATTVEKGTVAKEKMTSLPTNEN